VGFHRAASKDQPQVQIPDHETIEDAGQGDLIAPRYGRASERGKKKFLSIKEKNGRQYTRRCHNDPGRLYTAAAAGGNWEAAAALQRLTVTRTPSRKQPAAPPQAMPPWLLLPPRPPFDS
jgi:hypothetical protein